MAPSNLYVNKPGGVIVHLQDGRSAALGYGDPVPGFGASGEDTLADYVDPTKFADETPRRVGGDDAALRDAHERAAAAEGGQVHAGSNPVPSNYNQLDEDAAVRFVENLSRYPEAQAKVLIHERLYAGGRQRVLDAATDAARISMTVQLAELQPPSTEVGSTDAGFTGYGDPDKHPGGTDSTEDIVHAANAAAQALQTPAPTSASGDEDGGSSDEQPGSVDGDGDDQGKTQDAVGFDAFSYDDLKAYIDQHNLDVAKNLSQENMVAEIQKVEGHDKPQTPPASASQS